MPNSPSPRNPIPPPARPRRADLPHPLTFFLTIAQRRGVLAALRKLHPHRDHALLRALNLESTHPRPPID